MKITKRQLRRIIREEKARILSEQPISAEQGVQMTEYDIAEELVAALKKCGLGAEIIKQGPGTEVYIMTGGAEGITVQVLRRGR